MRLILILLLLFAQERPYLAVVPAVDTVYPGEVFSVTVTAFEVDAPIAFDAGGLEVVTTEQRGDTLYVTLRAEGAPRDIVVSAKAGGLSSTARIRICCRVATFPGRRLYLPILRR